MKNKLTAFTQNHISQIKGLIGLLVVFLILKSVAYFAPLLLIQIISPILYGEFEYSLNLGVILVGLFSFGLPSAYAYFVMKNKRTDLIPIFHLHFILLAFLLLISLLIYPSLLSNSVFGALIIGVAMSDQILVSNMLKANGRNIISVVVDTGIYLVLGVLVFLGLAEYISFTKELWFLSILITHLLFVIIVHARGIQKIKEISKASIIELYSFGLLILITAPLLTLITNSTRIYIEYFNDISEVGFYSFYFRLAAILLVIYRVLYILLFRKLFLENHVKLDLYFTIIIGLLGIASLGLVLVLNSPLSTYIVSSDSPYYPYYHLLPMMFFQVIFWINASFFEAILIREKQVKQFILLLVIILTVLLSTFQLISVYWELSLKLIVIINTWAIFILFLGQQYILIRKKIYYKKTIILHLVFGMIYALFLIL